MSTNYRCFTYINKRILLVPHKLSFIVNDSRCINDQYSVCKLCMSPWAFVISAYTFRSCLNLHTLLTRRQLLNDRDDVTITWFHTPQVEFSFYRLIAFHAASYSGNNLTHDREWGKTLQKDLSSRSARSTTNRQLLDDTRTWKSSKYIEFVTLYSNISVDKVNISILI